MLEALVGSGPVPIDGYRECGHVKLRHVGFSRV
jgi:hypothetical protein